MVCGTVRALHRSVLLIGGEGLLVFGEVFFLQSTVMSVGVAFIFDGTCICATVVFLFNWNSR